MLSARMQRCSHGVTLVELLVVLVIVAIGATLAAPSFAQMIANYKVRAAAESILGGLNLARTEALRRNAAVSFVLAAGGSGWSVNQVSPATVLQSRSDNDSPGTTVQSSNTATSVTFLPNGLLQSGTQMTQVSVSSLVHATDTRRINVFGGGLIRMCDPAITTADDPRRC
jgi:type IV fimbrial biogenesis protein FimT